MSAPDERRSPAEASIAPPARSGPGSGAAGRVAHLDDLGRVAARAAAELAEPVARYAELVRGTLAAERTVFFAGNGGSAAHAQHLATEYVVRYRPVERRAAAALALSTDSSLVTAAGNDLGFERIFARQVEAHGRKGDLLVLISTSGKSPNLLAAAAAARARGMGVVGLLAAGGGPLAALVDLAIVVPTDDTALAQEIQLAIDHHVCSLVEPGLA
jgi:D-sedoheptulose 7-phosphate isomerase